MRMKTLVRWRSIRRLFRKSLLLSVVFIYILYVLCLFVVHKLSDSELPELEDDENIHAQENIHAEENIADFQDLEDVPVAVNASTKNGTYIVVLIKFL